MKGICTGAIFGSPPPGALGPKGQISLNLNQRSISKIFKPNFVYLLTNERYKTYQMGFSFGRLGHGPGVGLRGTGGGGGGGGGGQKFFFFLEIQPDFVCELLT